MVKRTKLPEAMVTKLQRISERSRQDSKCEFKWLMQHYSVENLAGCFHELDGKKAVGIDEKTKEEYGRHLKSNLENLVKRMKTMSYRPSPVKLVEIPKASGGKRPLGIAVIEDKIVQSMTAKLLESIYEPVFLDCSYGFRPFRNCHQAIKQVNDFLYGCRRPVVYEIDFRNFFGSIDHKKLIQILNIRIKDEVFLRYMVRMLRSGIVSEVGFQPSEQGTTQGSICSPVLANIFAHYALDVWFQQIGSCFQGKVQQVRYCDDAVFLFSSEEDAGRFAKALKGRTERFGLELHPEKTKLLIMDKKKRSQGVRQPAFNFLGFTFFLAFSRKGAVVPKIKTDSQKMKKKIREIGEWLKKARNLGSMRQIWDQLRRKVRGYQEYFQVSHNSAMVRKFVNIIIKIFFKWMNRRSQRKSFSWEKFYRFLKVYPMPTVPVRKILFS